MPEHAAIIAALALAGLRVGAVNQAVRQDWDAAQRFIEAVERLRDTQAARPSELAEATERQRAELGQLTERARAALTSAGFSDSPEMRVALTRLLEAGHVMEVQAAACPVCQTRRPLFQATGVNS